MGNAEIITVGEGLVEIMRKGKTISFEKTGVFLGPYPSGAPCIFISTAAIIGEERIKTGFIGVVGNDDFGKVLLERLAWDGVDISGIRISDSFTGSAFIRYFPDGNRKFIFHPGAAAGLNPRDIKEEYFEKTKVLHISGSSLFISKTSYSACEKALKIATDKKALLSFDPNIRPEMAQFSESMKKVRDFLKEACFLFTTEEELSLLTGESQSAHEKTIRKIFDYGVRIIIVKKGGKGSEIITQQNRFSIPALKIKVIDPTGAGDSYAGAFIVSYLKGFPIEQCGKIAGITASLKCTRRGPMSIPAYEEVNRFYL